MNLAAAFIQMYTFHMYIYTLQVYILSVHGMHSLGTESMTSALLVPYNFIFIFKNLHFTTTVKNVCNLYSKMIQEKKWLGYLHYSHYSFTIKYCQIDVFFK